MKGKNSINLLQAELFPKQALITLKRVVLSWLFVFTLMVIASVTTRFQINQQQTQLQLLSATKAEQKSQLMALELKVAQNKPKQALTDRLATLKRLMTNKKALYAELTNKKSTYVTGFAKAMTDLSAMHSRDISLQRVEINHNNMTFFGMAKAPESVPVWLAQFESSSVLSGVAFNHFSLHENDSNYIDFVVSTTKQQRAPQLRNQQVKN